MKRILMERWSMVSVATLLVALGGCHNDKDEDLILPIRATLDIAPVADDPAVYFESGSVSNDLVTLNVRVRTSPGVAYQAVDLHIRFEPGIVQFMGMTQQAKSDGQTYEPFGLCLSSTTYCPANPYMTTNPPPGGALGPFCFLNDPNSTGDLIIGVTAQQQGRCDGGAETGTTCDPDDASGSCVTEGGTCRTCRLYDQGGNVKVMALTFRAATVGSSRIEIVPWAQTGDCEVTNDAVKLPIPCFDGGATVTGHR